MGEFSRALGSLAKYMYEPRYMLAYNLATSCSKGKKVKTLESYCYLHLELPGEQVHLLGSFLPSPQNSFPISHKHPENLKISKKLKICNLNAFPC